MANTPIDASFEDNNEISELDGAQLYDASSQRGRRHPAEKKAVRRDNAEERTAPDPRDAEFTDADIIEAEIAERKPAAPQKAVPGKAKPKTTRPSSAVRPPRERAIVRSSGAAALAKVKKAPREPVTIRSLGKGLVSIMSTKSDVRVKTMRNGSKKPLPVSAFVMAIICTLLLMFMIVSYVQINEYTVAVSELRSELGGMVDRDKELSLELEKKNDMLVIEQKAGELGMVKVDQLTKKHVTLTQDDKIEVVEPEPTYDSTVVTTIMSSIWQNFSGLWEYLG